MAVGLEKLVDLAGVVPFDKVDEAKLAIENFCSENIAVVVTNKSTNVAHGTHFHNSYEFTICHSNIPSSIIDNKLYDRLNNALFVVNHDISMLVRLFWEELRYKQLGHEFMMKNLSLLIIGNLIRQAKPLMSIFWVLKLRKQSKWLHTIY
ncbi:MAG: hypothetical protein WCY24_03470 [Lutispora sp.]|nr:hypothetical protein [Lutispora sp.]MDD4834130.1 hypothetical protein [Lutispora sp.]